MGSFKGHALPGSLFLAVGIWHIWNSITSYIANPKSFTVRAWYPVPGATGNIKYLELFVIITGTFIDLCVEFLYSPHLKIVAHGVLNPSHMNDFEHAGMLLMFFIFGITALISEKTRYLPLPHGALHLIALIAFCAEYLLFYFHSTSHAGLEGRYHQLLVLLVGLCIISSVLGAAFSSSFLVDLLNGVSLSLQGIWFYQIAFTLYGPMIPSGCNLMMHAVLCQSREFEMRGESLAHFQFSIVLLVVLALVVYLFGFAAKRHDHSNLLCFGNESQDAELNKKAISLHL
eukprot:Gb_12615 [translate_table: standard]